MQLFQGLLPLGNDITDLAKEIRVSFQSDMWKLLPYFRFCQQAAVATAREKDIDPLKNVLSELNRVLNIVYLLAGWWLVKHNGTVSVTKMKWKLLFYHN